MDDRTVHIVLVEDDDLDAEAVARAFRKQKIANPIHRVCDGVEALELLRGRDGQAPLRRPYLVLLDLNMPRMDGIEFLAELRADPHLRDTIVFVLTTSDADTDKAAAYASQVAGYLVKSKAGEDFSHLARVVECFWRYVEFPPEKTP